ncbi:MAG: MgtC/SapB family protein, partial [Elstera sp.]
GARAAGVRTFALTGLLGGVCGGLVPLTAPVVLGLGMLGFALIFGAFHWRMAQETRNYSATGAIAGLLTFALGAYAVLGVVQIAVAGAVALTILLALKQPLHAWIRALTWPEVRAGLVLLAMSFLALPILPNRPIDPWGAVNPAEIWLLAIIIAALSFIGYGAVRILGARGGIALMALAGGLSSSTAVTVTLSRISRDAGADARTLAGGILLAGAMMLGRVVLVAGTLNPALFVPLALPLGAALLVFLASAGLLLAQPRSADTETALTLRNPLELAVSLKLAAFIAVTMLLATLIGRYFGETGLYLLAASSGLADVDALTLSFAQTGETALPLGTATIGITIAVMANTLSKAVMALILGTKPLGLIVGGVSIGAISAGALAQMLI